MNGKQLGLPMTGSAQGMAINLDIMKEIGYTVPDNWTIDDFLKMTYRDWETDRKSTRLNSSHSGESRMPSSA